MITFRKALKKNWLLVFASLFSLVSCNQTPSHLYSRVETIVLTASSEKANKLASFVHDFNNKYSTRYKIIINSYEDSSVLNYYFSHDYIDTDIMAFDNLNVANIYADYLQPLNRFESIGEYQSSITYLLNYNGNINVVPGPGDLYSLCYNIDLMSKRNFDIPNTIDELQEEARRMQVYSNPCVTVGNDQLYFDSFMRLAIPMFIGTTKGTLFINDYYYGNTSIQESDYYDNFYDILKRFQSLYRYGFYNTDESLSNTEKMDMFFNSESMVLGLNPSIDFEKEYNKRGSTFNYVIYPLVSMTDSQKWAASKPRYFLGVSKKSYEDASVNKKKAIDAFFDYYASQDGQKAAIKDEDGVSKNDVVTYIKNTEYELSEEFEQLENSIKAGRIMITDFVEILFFPMASTLKDLASQKISIEQCIQALDEGILKIVTKTDADYHVTETFDYDYTNIRNKETKIGNYIADTLRQKSGALLSVFPNSVIQGNIVAGSLYSSELSSLIKNDRGILVRMSGKGVKKMLTDKLALNGTGEFPIFSGFRLEQDGDSVNIRLSSGQLITDDQNNDLNLLVYISYSWYEEYKDYIVSVGNSYYAYDMLKEKIEENSNIVQPGNLDGRYGNLK